MSEHIRGVNLGGWLVLEKWMAPGLFAGRKAEDEYGLMLELGTDSEKVLTAHRDSFITEDDFIWIKDHGLTAVRLPVGYWLFGGQAPYLASSSYVDQAFEWAKKHDLRVLLDLHALPGSQNGWDHSGQIGEIGWHKDKANVRMSLEVLRQIADRYGNHDNLLGIEVINEPHWDVPMGALLDYYERAYDVLDARMRSDAYIVIHDGFRPHEMAPKLANRGFRNLVLDIHLYQLFFGQYADMSLEQHINHAKTAWEKELRELSRYLPVIVGEWSASLDAGAFAKGLTEDERREGHLRYATAQIEVFRLALGSFYWNYKAVSAGTWSLHDYPEYTS